MPDEYTPTTGEIVDAWVNDRMEFGSPRANIHDAEEACHAEFARWLSARDAARDAQVKAEQREKDALIAESKRPEVGTHINMTEYRTGKYDAATIIAAAIRGGEKNA